MHDCVNEEDVWKNDDKKEDKGKGERGRGRGEDPFESVNTPAWTKPE